MPKAILLVVCRDSERREGFVNILAQAGWPKVLSASSMAEAAKMLRNASSACVIVDCELQDIPGLKAVPIMRSLCAQIDIVFTAPRNTRGLEARVRSLDVYYYSIGSADPVELVAAVAGSIGAPVRERKGGPPQVLIVDDDPDFHTTTRAFLRSTGYLIASACSAREGIELARRLRPDVILLDIIMQTSTDGFEFCREVRRDPLVRHTPILGVSAIENLSGSPRPMDFEPGLFPVDGYLSKPVAPETLLAELERLLPAKCRLDG